MLVSDPSTTKQAELAVRNAISAVLGTVPRTRANALRQFSRYLPVDDQGNIIPAGVIQPTNGPSTWQLTASAMSRPAPMTDDEVERVRVLNETATAVSTIVDIAKRYAYDPALIEAIQLAYADLETALYESVNPLTINFKTARLCQAARDFEAVDPCCDVLSIPIQEALSGALNVLTSDPTFGPVRSDRALIRSVAPLAEQTALHVGDLWLRSGLRFDRLSENSDNRETFGDLAEYIQTIGASVSTSAEGDLDSHTETSVLSKHLEFAAGLLDAVIANETVDDCRWTEEMECEAVKLARLYRMLADPMKKLCRELDPEGLCEEPVDAVAEGVGTRHNEVKRQSLRGRAERARRDVQLLGDQQDEGDGNGRSFGDVQANGDEGDSTDSMTDRMRQVREEPAMTSLPTGAGEDTPALPPGDDVNISTRAAQIDTSQPTKRAAELPNRPSRGRPNTATSKES